MPRHVAFLSWLLAWLLSPHARAQNVFDIARRPAEHAVVTLSPQPPDLNPPRSEMLDLLRGVVAELSDTQRRELRACGVRTRKLPGPVLPADAKPVWWVHLSAKGDRAVVEIYRLTDGRFAARADTAPSEAVTLDADRFTTLASDWPRRGGQDFFEPTDRTKVSPGKVAPAPHPHPASSILLTRDELGERFLNGRETSIDGAAREIEREEFLVRLPRASTPRTPLGVLVWVDAADRAELRAPLHAACDELDLVLIGAVNTGNARPAADRWQLALDAVEIARTHVLIDPRRVYVSGISGGGKIATHLWACFPDVFTGAVPIVGMASYRDIPAGGGKVWRADFEKPRDPKRLAALRINRCAALTGPPDFNAAQIIGTAKIMQADRLAVRVFEHPDLGHTMPTPAQFTEAMRWVDQPSREHRDAVAAKALAAWEALASPEGPASDTPQRIDALVQITQIAPWTPWAWRAAEELGLAPASQAPRDPTSP